MQFFMRTSRFAILLHYADSHWGDLILLGPRELLRTRRCLFNQDTKVRIAAMKMALHRTIAHNKRSRARQVFYGGASLQTIL